MTDRSNDYGRAAAQGARPPLDFQLHLKELERQGLLVHVDRPINKDTELHPLVRWQFLGGIPENDRKAFVFTNVVDEGPALRHAGGGGRARGLAAIYAIGMGMALDEIGEAWNRAIAIRSRRSSSMRRAARRSWSRATSWAASGSRSFPCRCRRRGSTPRLI